MKTLTMILSVVLFLGLTVGSAWYVPYRLGKLLDLSRIWPLYIVAAVFIVGYPALSGVAASRSSVVLGWATNLAGLALGFHLFALLLMLATDLLRLGLPIPDKPAAGR